MKESLALTYTKCYPLFLRKVMTEKPSIPKALSISEIMRRLTQIRSNSLSLLLVKFNRSPWTFGIMQSSESFLFKAMQPIPDSSRAMAKQLCHLIAADSGAYHKNCIKTMVISGFFRSLNLLLNSNFNNVRILNLKFTHNASLPAIIVAEKSIMSNYLCRYVLLMIITS